MRPRHNRPPHRVVVSAARSALRFAVRRRIAMRRNAWRFIALYWRSKRNGWGKVRTARSAPTAAAISLVQFHLRCVIREKAHGRVHATKRSSPVAVSRQTRVMTERRRTIIQSRVYQAQQGPPTNKNRFAPGHLQSNTAPKNQATERNSNSAQRLIDPAIPTAAAARALFPLRGSSRTGDRPYSPNPGRTSMRVRRIPPQDEQDQAFQPIQNHKIELHRFRPRFTAMRHMTPAPSRERAAAQLEFRPRELVWRRSVQPAPDIAGSGQPWEFDAQAQPHGRSFPGRKSSFETSPSSGPAPATPALKLDPTLVDRLADDVIRRVERRARIERARQGL